MSIVYWNGSFRPQHEASIGVTEPAVLFGRGLFTTLRVEEGEACAFARHLRRLERQCEQLRFPMPSRFPIGELISQNGAETGLWRLKIALLPDLLMTLEPYTPPTRLRVGIYPTPLSGPLLGLKTVSYLERLLLREFAKEQGWDECLTLSREGYVMEGASANLFWTDEERLYTPDSRHLPILQGTYLEELMETTHLEVERVRVRPHELPSTLYLCNALQQAVAADVIPAQTALCGERR